VRNHARPTGSSEVAGRNRRHGIGEASAHIWAEGNMVKVPDTAGQRITAGW